MKLRILSVSEIFREDTLDEAPVEITIMPNTMGNLDDSSGQLLVTFDYGILTLRGERSVFRPNLKVIVEPSEFKILSTDNFICTPLTEEEEKA